jgi:DNA-binding MarR family transcriptional regulator
MPRAACQGLPALDGWPLAAVLHGAMKFDVKRFDVEVLSEQAYVAGRDPDVEDHDKADHVDRIIEGWAEVRPDLDVSPQAIIGRISRLSRFLERDVTRVFKEFGLTGGEFDVLATLRRRQEPLTPSELAKACMLSSAAMTNRIDRLESSNLVSRRPDPSDRRGVLVGLAPQGRLLIDRAFEAHLENEAEMVAVLTPAQRETLANLLKTLLLPLEQQSAPARQIA